MSYTTAGGDGLIFNSYLSNVFDEIDKIKMAETTTENGSSIYDSELDETESSVDDHSLRLK